MDDQLIKQFKLTGYTLGSLDHVTKCACLAARHGLAACDIAEEFEVFAITK